MLTEIVPQLYTTWHGNTNISNRIIPHATDACLVGLGNSVSILSIYFASATYLSTQQQQQRTSLSMREKKRKNNS